MLEIYLKNFLACDPRKLQRARHKVLKNAKNSDYDNIKSSDPISAIYFDGRRDLTLSMISDQDGILHRRIVKEEHITITAEPEGKYLSHFTPEEPTYPEKPALKEAEGLYNLLHNIGAIESCLVLGGDSTASYTGNKGGSICHLEKLLNHKCHWNICMIHTNELPVRHLIQKLDGPTTSNTGFSGNVCKPSKC